MTGTSPKLPTLFEMFMSAAEGAGISVRTMQVAAERIGGVKRKAA
jgi:hypothetical protein